MKKLRNILFSIFLMACFLTLPVLTLMAFDDLDDLYGRLKQLKDLIYDTQNTNSPYEVMIGHWKAIDNSSDLYLTDNRIIIVNNDTKRSTALNYTIVNAHLELFVLCIKLINHSGIAVQTELITFSADLKVMTRTVLNADPNITEVYTKSYGYVDSKKTP